MSKQFVIATDNIATLPMAGAISVAIVLDVLRVSASFSDLYFIDRDSEDELLTSFALS